MRQSHVADEKLFVDYAGHTVPVIDPVTGEISPAQIFVVTLGASNYIPLRCYDQLWPRYWLRTV